MRKEIDIWLEQAEIDLESAEINFNQKLYYVCAFLCQQSLEKIMKALFMLREKSSPPATHNLRELGEALGLPQELLSKARKISRDFILSRYPDAAGDVPAKIYDKEITKEILEETKELFAWLEKQFS